MSLEDAIKKNTEALEKLTGALAQFASSGSGAAAPTAKTEPVPKEEKTAKKPAAKEKEAAAKDAPAFEGKVYLEQVKPLTLTAIKTLGREKVAEILQEFVSTATSAKDLFESQYEPYIARLKEVLESDLA